MIPLLIFDSFPTNTAAVLFAAAAATEHELDVAVFHTVSAAQAADPTPANLRPPIVHVDRHDDDGTERVIVALAETFGGVYVGT